MIKSSPEITINSGWLRDELFQCLDPKSKFISIIYMPGTQRKGKKIANRVVINIYFNNKRKLNTDSLKKHKVKSLKKNKEKNNSK